MPELQITIGGKEFSVACQPGEEDYLRSAAALLDREATTLASQIGRLPDGKMLLMAGLMLADRTAAYEEKVSEVEDKLRRQEKMIAEMGTLPSVEPKQVEVAVVPPAHLETLAGLAARAEAAADLLEEKTAD